jgi:Fic family protein
MGDGLRNNDAAPGILRGADPDHAINVGVRGPPPKPYMNNQDVLPAMNELMDWYNANKATMPAPELAGKFYQRMASIHPFTDANGRTSRMAADWILQSEGYPPSDFGSIRLWAGDTGKPTAVEASVAGLEKAVNIYKQVTGEALPVTPAVGGP